MYDIKYYDQFVAKDIRKLKENLLTWATKNPTGMMLFNTEIVPEIEEKMRQQNVSGYVSTVDKKICIENLLIEYYQLGGQKGIIKRMSIMISPSEGIIIQNEPYSWKNAEVYYEFK